MPLKAKTIQVNTKKLDECSTKPLRRPCILGIDPGLTGAWAAVSLDGDLLAVADMPTAKRGKRDWVDPQELAGRILEFGERNPIELVAVEDVHAMPRQGVTSSFRFGHAFGVAVSVAAFCGAETLLVTPQAWKKWFGLIGAGKGDSRHMADAWWPGHADIFRRAKDDGRAEAALIALYALQSREGKR